MTQAAVLIVEDNDFLSYELAEVLAEDGCEVVGREGTYAGALGAIEAHRIDLCVLDLDLGHMTDDAFGPGGEGLRLLAILGSKGIPTVVYSANLRTSTPLDQFNAAVIGVDKSEPPARVREAVRTLCRGRP